MKRSVLSVTFVLLCVLNYGNAVALRKQSSQTDDVEKLAIYGNCGFDGPSGRIINGKDAPEGAFPYQVSLRYRLRHRCGGSIINDRWILTAAHCVLNLRANDVTVVVGSNKLNSGGTIYQSKKLIYHRGFSFEHVQNDVGLILLKNLIRFGNNVKPIALPTSNINVNNHPAVISGWGRIRVNGEVPNNLQYISTCLLDQKSCKNYIPFIKNGNICSFTKIGQGNCNGDSGGPLVANNVQVGIVSYVVNTCAAGYPDVYTRVWSYRSWINDQMVKYQ